MKHRQSLSPGQRMKIYSVHICKKGEEKHPRSLTYPKEMICGVLRSTAVGETEASSVCY